MIVYLIFLILSLIWLLIIFTGPYLATFGNDFELLLQLYYLCFKLICHQIPERSYFIFDHQMPVCVRCLGIYTGLPIGLIIYPLFKRLNNTILPPFKYMWIFFAPILIDGTAQTFHFYSSSHYIRLFTGIWISSGLIFWAMPLINQLFIKYFKLLDN